MKTTPQAVPHAAPHVARRAAPQATSGAPTVSHRVREDPGREREDPGTGTSVDAAATLWFGAACFMLAGAVVVLPAWFTDSRTLDGVGVWNKPLKFWVSLFMHFATLAVLVRLVPRSTGARSRVLGLVLWSTAAVSVTAGVLENLYINLQAARGRASHFNVSTDLEIALYAAMGIGAVLLVIASLVVGVAILVPHRSPDGLRLGAGLGLVIGSLLTIVVAGYMGSQGSHYVGVDGSDAGGLPITGWSTTLPDLRPAHFVALHLMQVLPCIGLVADRLAPGRATRIVGFAAVAGVVACLVLFGLALSGRPPIGFLNALDTSHGG